MGTSFKPSPADKPGFILYDSVEQLGHNDRRQLPLPVMTPFQMWKQTQGRVPLAEIRTKKTLDIAIKEYENQEPMSVLNSLRHSPKPDPATLEGAIAEALTVSEVINTPHDLIDPAPSPSTHDMQLMSIMKWRKRKMRGHKYKKRLRKNRYKSKP